MLSRVNSDGVERIDERVLKLIFDDSSSLVFVYKLIRFSSVFCDIASSIVPRSEL